MKYLIILIIAGALIAALTYNLQKPSPYGNLDDFARCLAEKEITMYGADWCPHCQNEKARFGNAFKYVPYVECPDNPKLCLEKGVEGYPTWMFPDGTKFEGELGLEGLSKATSCALPQK